MDSNLWATVLIICSTGTCAKYSAPVWCSLKPQALGKSGSQVGSEVALLQLLLVLRCSQQQALTTTESRLQAINNRETVMTPALAACAEQHAATCSHGPPAVGQAEPFQTGVRGPLLPAAEMLVPASLAA